MTTVQAPIVEPRQMETGARSYIYKYLAAAFSFPGAHVARHISSGAWLLDVLAICSRLPHPFTIEPSEAEALRAGAGRDSLEARYIALFEVGAGRPFCPLYEGAHRRGRMKLMEDLVRFYEHFGLRPLPGDPPDHLCTQLQFMHFLAFKQAAASGQPAIAAAVRAQHDFLERHLCRWLPRVRARLASSREAGTFYARLCALAERFCAADLQFLKSCREKSHASMMPCPTEPAPAKNDKENQPLPSG
jgi:DMSO reductase family type II enzyme chaperone